MAVRKRPDRDVYMIDIYYQDQRGVQQRLRRSVGRGKTLKEAQKIERDLKRELTIMGHTLAENGFSAPSDRKEAAFSGFADHYYEIYCKVHNKPSELRAKEMIFRLHLVPFFGDRDLREIDQELIEKFIALKLKQGLSPKTINNRLGVLRTMLNIAIKWGYLEKNPVNDVKTLKTPPDEFDYFTPEESDKFLEAAIQKHRIWHPFFLLLFRTGLRLGEALELRWKDIDLKRKMISVRRNFHRGHVGTPKSGKGRDIPMTPALTEALKARKGKKGDLLFVTRNDRHIGRTTILRNFHKICDTAELRHIKIHEIRHSFASQLVVKGVHLQVVQQLLGHSDIRMTMRYSHLSPQQHHDAVAMLEDASE